MPEPVIRLPLALVSTKPKWAVLVEVEVLVEADDEDEAAMEAITTLDAEATFISGRVVDVERYEPYYCGSNHCDDPACQQEHAELL